MSYLYIGIITYSGGLCPSDVYGKGQVYSHTTPPYIFQRRVSSGWYIPIPGVVRTFFPSGRLTNPVFCTEKGEERDIPTYELIDTTCQNNEYHDTQEYVVQKYIMIGSQQPDSRALQSDVDAK